MKRKGISLIVLIITIVVIIILAASIILNMSKINIINNANAAVLKQDIATLQSELDLYKADRFVDKRGKYDATKLSADTSKATYGTESIEDKNSDGSSNIHDILTSLKKSRYKDNVYIQEGRLVFKKSGLKDEEVEIILEMGLEVDGMPKVTSIETNSEYTSVQIALNVTLAEEVEKVIYILNDGEREESKELTKTYTGLTQGVNYTLEVILVLKDGTEISKKEIISTKSINGQLKYTLSENDWTNKDVTVTIEYSEEIPEGYELQYKLIGNMTKDWTKYTGAITVSENNTTVVGRIYNEILDDEYVDGSSREVSKIDKEAPTSPITLTLTPEETTITAVASGSTDVGSGIDKYMYSIDNKIWQENGKFTGLTMGTEYTIYVKVIDKVGYESEVKFETISTKSVPVSSEDIINNVNDFYGKKVKNYIPNNGSAVEWKIFHSDGENIYLIADKPVPVAELPYTTNADDSFTTNKTTSLAGYSAAIGSAITDYEGSSRVREIVKYLNYDYFVNNSYSSTENGLKVTAFILDNVAWNVFGNKYSKFAIGGPTLQLLFDSYNKKYGTEYECIALSATGYHMRKKSTDEWTYELGGVFNTSDSLYYTPSVVVPIATPSGVNKWLVYQMYSNKIESAHYTSLGYGYRPVVCLNSDVKLEASGDGFIIVE